MKARNSQNIKVKTNRMRSGSDNNPVIIAGDFRRANRRPTRRGLLLILPAFSVVILVAGFALQIWWLLALAAIPVVLAWIFSRIGRLRETAKLRLDRDFLTITGNGYKIRLKAPFRFSSGIERKPATDRQDESCFVRMVLDIHGKPLVLEEQVIPGLVPPKLDDIAGISSALGIAELTSCTPFPGTLWELIRQLERLSKPNTEAKVDQSLTSLYQLSDLQRAEGLYTQAIDTLTAIIRQRPDSAHAYYSRGVARYEQRREPDKAINDFSTSLRLQPDQVEVYRMRGLTRGQADDWAGMREDCTQAIRLQPKSADLHNLRGTACFRLQDYDAAIDDFDHSIALDNGRYESYYNRGLVKQRQMKLEEALVDFRYALGLNPRFEAATRSISSLERYLADVRNPDKRRLASHTNLDGDTSHRQQQSQ